MKKDAEDSEKFWCDEILCFKYGHGQLVSAIQFTSHLDVMGGYDGGPHDNHGAVLILLPDTELMNQPEYYEYYRT